MTYQIHLGDCVATMRAMPEHSVDSIVTDPPYELGFMGKGWDSTGIANSVEMWSEALRVLKPGGHLLAFSGSRTYHRMVCAIEDAGFEIRDQIMWVYGSGFPKSLDVSKAIDKAAGVEREQGAANPAFRARQLEHETEWKTAMRPEFKTVPATDAARQWQGWGTALKPAHEPIVVARKPLIGTVAANVLAHGTGAINVDGCRVPGEGQMRWETPRGGIWSTDSTASAKLVPTEQGRWPANLIHDGSDEVLSAFPADAGRFYYAAKCSQKDRNEGCEGVTTWENADLQSALAAVQQLQKATFDISTLLQDDHEWSTTLFGSEPTAQYLPVIKSIIETIAKQTTDSTTSNYSARSSISGCIQAAIATAAASGSSLANFAECTNPSRLNTTCEKTASAAGAVHAALLTLSNASAHAKQGNIHSTVKPTDLMRYLVRLVTPPGGLVLDPFTGSGSTGKAAMLEGFWFVGCELSPEYAAIAEARISAAACGGFA